ncbi:MAG: glutamine amidotransferase [Tepidisphaeraceae bacterium]
MDPHLIVYFGDSSLAGAAGYLAGLMTLWGMPFDYLPSDRSTSLRVVEPRRKLFILSDYPSKMISSALQQTLVDQVHRGAGLLMIGGWESFCGQGGDWAGTPVGAALPVQIDNHDDRINCDQPALILKKTDHPTAGALPWQTRPPTVGGFNRIAPKEGATVVLEAQRFAASVAGVGRFDFRPTSSHPLLIVGQHGTGRTAALATDLAPHWVGGLVDWGDGRVTATAEGSWSIEVGDLYAAFVRNLLTWTGQLK